eukprot:1845934-Pyramimonas_sp.AAC.1
MGHRMWIDDISQRTTGSRRAVRRNLTKAVFKTGQELDKVGLKIAEKSVVMCTNVNDAQAVVKAARSQGFPL